MEGDPVYGAGCLIRGGKMLSHPKLRPFVLVPLTINVLIFGSLISWGLSNLIDWVNSWMAWLPEWLSFLEWILWPIIGLTVALVTGYLFTAVALLIASPFNALLAEKAEELITGQPVQGLEGLGAALMSVPRGIFRELAKLVYYLPMALMVLIISFIPAVNAIAPLLWLFLGAWMMSLQFVDYPMDNHQFSFKDVRIAVADRRLSSLGFGGMVAALASIPIVNFFVVPAAVVGATILYVEELR
ncbi:sulfate transporter CysZ [Congregibacter brevis]|uniref:Sulfate transporter CysZ n=1 Tax=Congregibacter brevis TaxID=3081201 RepID=A0ABZ0IJF7_9GAMM|nr:sulfate transporter CysZ [Congregibacter sp. IMCC45268]